jgi:hypothetical protein
MDSEMAKFFEGYPVHFAGQLIGTVCAERFVSHCSAHLIVGTVYSSCLLCCGRENSYSANTPAHVVISVY